MDLFDFAARRRDIGMGRAADAEDRDQPSFGDTAFEAIKAIAERQDTVHVDDVLQNCTVRPHHHNAWGAVWMRAIKANLIRRTGAVRPCMTDPKKNGHNYPVYESLIFVARQ